MRPAIIKYSKNSFVLGITLSIQIRPFKQLFLKYLLILRNRWNERRCIPVCKIKYLSILYWFYIYIWCSVNCFAIINVGKVKNCKCLFIWKQRYLRFVNCYWLTELASKRNFCKHSPANSLHIFTQNNYLYHIVTLFLTLKVKKFKHLQFFNHQINFTLICVYNNWFHTKWLFSNLI